MLSGYGTIKTSPPRKWIEKKKYDEVVDELQKTKDGKNLAEIFTPESLMVEDGIYNKDGRAFDTSIGDMISPDGNVYYHYFYYEDDQSTASDSWRTGVFIKRKGENPSFLSGTLISEGNYNYNSVSRNVNARVKIEGNDIKVSTLILKEYDSNGLSTRGGAVTLTLYCINYTNAQASSLITLGTLSGLDDSYGYNYTQFTNRDELRTASCGISAEESISRLDKGYISLSRGRNSNYANIILNLN